MPAWSASGEGSHMADREGELSGVSCRRALIPFMRVLLS